MIEIYHNTRCSTSRAGLKILEDSGKNFEIIKYMEEPVSPETLQNVIKLLKIKPIELIRQKESIWKENFQNKKLSNSQLIKLMVKYPKLMERPIVINGNKAAIGRPPEKILEIL